MIKGVSEIKQMPLRCQVKSISLAASSVYLQVLGDDVLQRLKLLLLLICSPWATQVGTVELPIEGFLCLLLLCTIVDLLQNLFFCHVVKLAGELLLFIVV